MAETVLLNEFIDKHGLELIIAGATLIGFIILYKKFRPQQKQIDYAQLNAEMMVKEERFNKPNSLDPKWIWRGDEKIGRIISIDKNSYRYNPTKEETSIKAGLTGFEADLMTVTFKQKDFMGTYIFTKPKMMMFSPDDARVREKNLLFSSDVGFTAIGHVYTTKTSYKQVAQVIESEWSKRLLESNVTVMASKMSHISAETPEMAHELSLKRLEIEKIRAEKQAKVGGLI